MRISKNMKAKNKKYKNKIEEFKDTPRAIYIAWCIIVMVWIIVSLGLLIGVYV